jgi:hypothetical protein
MSVTDCGFIVMTGLNTTPRDLPAEVAMRLNDSWAQIHTPDVTEANPGFVRGSRFQLVTEYAPGDTAPTWAVVYDVTVEESIKAYIERDAGPREAYPALRYWTDVHRFPFVWRTMWERVAGESGQLGAAAAPYLHFVAQRVPAGADERQLVDYFTETHAPWVLANTGCTRATLYRLYHELMHPEPGAPEFLAAYEGAEPLTAYLGGGGAGADPLALPDAVTAWNILYRRISSYVRNALIFGEELSLGKPPR